eukprot:3996984-Heterocapsa_arctica.AAC.1
MQICQRTLSPSLTLFLQESFATPPRASTRALALRMHCLPSVLGALHSRASRPRLLAAAPPVGSRPRFL